jgi:hypothetical protein
VRKLKSHLTYANVMATVAVFLALGGVATAAFTVPKKSVGPKQLKAKAVTEPKIGDKAVTEGKLGDGAVTNAKIGSAAVDGAKVKDQSIGLAKTAILDTTVTQNFSTISVGSCQGVDKPVPVALQQFDDVQIIADPTVGSGDNTWYGGALTVFAGPPDTPGVASIQLHACNPTSVAADPPNTTFRILAFR